MTIANRNIIPVTNSGSSIFSVDKKSVLLKDILLAPNVKKNLLSVSRFCADNIVSLRFDQNNVYLKELQNDSDEGGLYKINLDAHRLHEVNNCNADLQTWHY